MTTQLQFGEPTKYAELVQQKHPDDFQWRYRNYLVANDGTMFGFRHEDYDGPGDGRYGHGETLEHAKRLIDMQLIAAAEQGAWMTVQQAADVLNVSTRHIYRMLRTPKARGKLVGRKRMVQIVWSECRVECH